MRRRMSCSSREAEPWLGVSSSKDGAARARAGPARRLARANPATAPLHPRGPGARGPDSALTPRLIPVNIQTVQSNKSARFRAHWIQRVAGAVTNSAICGSFRQGLVDRELLAGPGLLRRPCSRGTGPEGVPGREAEGQQADRAEVEAAGRDVAFAHRRLVSTEADAQPAVRVERPRRLDRAADHGGQGAPDLGGRQALGKVAPQGHLREQVEGAEAVGEGPADGG